MTTPSHPLFSPDDEAQSLASAWDNAAINVPDLSHSILAQLQADQQEALPCQYDAEFISAYVDAELSEPSADADLAAQRITLFEKHLPQCLSCNQILGQFIQIQEGYRLALFKLESQLEQWTIVSSVMDAYQYEQQHSVLVEHNALPPLGCGYAEPPEWYALLDAQPLENEEALQQHEGVCEPCRMALAQARNALALQRQCYNAASLQRLSPNNLNLWPRLAQSLSRDKVVVLQHKKRRSIATTAISIAASVLFILAVGRSFIVPQAAEPTTVYNPAALEAALQADSVERNLLPKSPVNVIYETPEAYLFSQESDIVSEQALSDAESEDTDVSALVLDNFY